METKTGLKLRFLLAATALVAPMMGAVSASAAVSEDYLNELCARTTFLRSEIRRIQRSPDFPEIVEYTLATCPAVMAALTSLPTATIPAEETDRRDDNRSPSGGGGGDGGDDEGEGDGGEGDGDGDGGGKKDGPGKNVGGPGKNVGGPGKNVGGPGKNVGGPGKNVGGPGKNVDGPGRQGEDPDRDGEQGGQDQPA